jgi:hypothetical protein
MTSVRSPARTSLTSWTERSWPTASGVSVSGSGTVSRSGRTGSTSGICRAGAPDRDVLGRLAAGDLDHPSTSIGTWRMRFSGSASGSSTRRIPSR